MRSVTVVEYTDPVCPWAWGSEPKFRWLRRLLGPDVAWRRVFGILFDDDDEPAPDPAAETVWYHGQLRDIARHTGAPAPVALARVAATSWPASLAAKAAQAQGPAVAERALRRLREHTFVLGVPPDTAELALAAMRGVPGLDLRRLGAEMRTEPVRVAVRRDWAETRTPCADVLHIDAPGPHNGRVKPVGDDGHRYALPTLVFAGPAGRTVVPGWRPLDEYVRAARLVAPDRGAGAEPPPLDPDDALHRYRSLTGPELRLLTGHDRAPDQAVRVDTATGPLWLHPTEAASRGIGHI